MKRKMKRKKTNALNKKITVTLQHILNIGPILYSLVRISFNFNLTFLQSSILNTRGSPYYEAQSSLGW